MRTILAIVSGLILWTTMGSVSQAQECKRPRMLIVLDKSSSMVTGFSGGQTKWDVAKDALTKVVTKYEATIDFGLMVFPVPNQCAGGQVKVGIGPYKAQQIINELASAPPSSGNWTPMAQSLDIAATVQNLQDTSYKRNVLLITDGWQWCDPYVASTRFLPVNSVANLKTLGITTYVVGFGDSVDALTLNKMATTSGTESAAGCDGTGADPTASNNCYYQSDTPKDLLSALQKIATMVSAEQCDGEDNNCNGQVDEGLTRPCSSACGTGVESCVSGTWTNCNAPAPTSETCDGVDNDCDGSVDEDCGCTEGATQPCGDSVGQCTQGSQTCTGGSWGPCTGGVVPSTEICDGVDNDCDGATDEDLSRDCSNACGVGQESCIGGKYDQCTAPQYSAETCDGLDNDCDGVVDGDKALCGEGMTCVNGACQPVGGMSNASGCDCNVSRGSAGGVAAPAKLLPLSLFGLLLLVALRRRR